MGEDLLRRRVTALKAKPEFEVHYLKMLDLRSRARAFDFTPEGWDITVHQLLHRLDAYCRASDTRDAS